MRWFFLLILFVANTVLAESSVWVATKGQYKLFIGGTVHVLSTDDYPLPIEFERAYSKSDQLVFETDINDTGSPQFQALMLQRMSYPDGKTLETELSDEAYTALEDYFISRGLSVNSFMQLRPQMITIVMAALELQRIGMVSTGVDDYFFQKARKDKKPIQYLESVEQQLDILVSMGAGQENELILNTVRDLGSFDQLMEDMKTAWRKGDEKKFEQVAVFPMQNEFPALYQSLLVNRNNAWLSYIERMMTTSDIEFVLVGALHLIGEDGVLQQLKARGYQVSKM